MTENNQEKSEPVSPIHAAIIHDRLSIALAEREDCMVVTADERMVNTFPNRAMSLAGW